MWLLNTVSDQKRAFGDRELILLVTLNDEQWSSSDLIILDDNNSGHYFFPFNLLCSLYVFIEDHLAKQRIIIAGFALLFFSCQLLRSLCIFIENHLSKKFLDVIAHVALPKQLSGNVLNSLPLSIYKNLEEITKIF